MIHKARVSVVVSRTYEYWEEIDTDDYEEGFFDDLEIKEVFQSEVFDTQTKWIHENAKLIDASIEDVEILSVEEVPNADGL